jgi:hypothetical protein
VVWKGLGELPRGQRRFPRVQPIRAAASSVLSAKKAALANKTSPVCGMANALPKPRQVAPRSAGSWRSLSLRSYRLDAERHPRPNRRLGRRRFEINPAAWRELVLVSDHAGRDPVDIGNFRTAKPERIARAGLLLFLGISPACGRQRDKRERRCREKTAPKCFEASCRHESPYPVVRELWVKALGFASRPIRNEQNRVRG